MRSQRLPLVGTDALLTDQVPPASPPLLSSLPTPNSEEASKTVSADEFIRRFLLHALPPGFQRIRYYGFLANCHRATRLGLCRRLLATPTADLLPRAADYRDFYLQLTGINLRLCPQCGIGALIRLALPGPLPQLVDTS